MTGEGDNGRLGGEGEGFFFLKLVLRCFVVSGVRIGLFDGFTVWRCQQGCLKGAWAENCVFVLWLGRIYGGQHWPSPFFAINPLHFTYSKLKRWAMKLQEFDSGMCSISWVKPLSSLITVSSAYGCILLCESEGE